MRLKVCVPTRAVCRKRFAKTCFSLSARAYPRDGRGRCFDGVTLSQSGMRRQLTTMPPKFSSGCCGAFSERLTCERWQQFPTQPRYTHLSLHIFLLAAPSEKCGEKDGSSYWVEGFYHASSGAGRTCFSRRPGLTRPTNLELHWARAVKRAAMFSPLVWLTGLKQSPQTNSLERR